MEGFSTQHEQQLHHSSALPYCFLSEPEPLPVPGFPAGSSNLEAAAAMVYESSRSSSLDTSSMSMVYSPVLLQLQESRPSFEAAAGGDKRRMVAIGGSNTTSLGSTQEMDEGGGKSRKQKRSNVGVKGLQEKKARGHGDVKAKEAGGEPPAGYIHVRARRGQATDSHSLAERVRREKISEKMKMLQSLVPGCDKVTGKALMLDEIISYVQSLQNQVEFLSMKLASLNPMMMYEFGLDLDMYPNVPQVLKMAQMPHELVQCMGQGNHLPTGAPHTSLEEAQGPTGFAQDGGGSSIMRVGGEQGQEGAQPLHQVEFSNMCFFQ